MQRACDACGVSYEAKRSTSKFCSTRCRVRNAEHPKPEPSELPRSGPDIGLVVAVHRDLEVADRLDSVPGRQALTLAVDMCSPFTLASAKPGLSKELSRVLAIALDGVQVRKADAMDEIAARRAAKAASA